MINFFRRIRKKLADDNKPLKYARYAIGEIVLVVIGILIALQINNWNEYRKAKTIEKELLQQFHTELNSDINAIENTLIIYKEVNYSCEVLIKHIKNRGAYHDSLTYHFARWNSYEHFNLNSGAISNLNSRGVDIISNPDLRNSILNLYNQTYTYSKDIGGFFREDHIAFTYPMFLKRIEPVEWRNNAIPNNYETLIVDHEFMNHLQWIKNASLNNLNFYKEAIIEIQNVINAIEIELNESKNV